MLLLLVFILCALKIISAFDCNHRKCDFLARHGMTRDYATTQLEQNKNAGWTLINLDGYTDGQQDLFIGLWKRNCMGQRFISYNVLDLDPSSFEIELVKQKLQGNCLQFVNAWNSISGRRYITMWKYLGGLCDNEIEAHDLTSNDYQLLFDYLTARNYKLQWTSAHESNGQARFATIFKHGISNNFVSYHGMTSQQYQDKFDFATKSLGYVLQWVNTYIVNGAERYIALFEQVSSPYYFARHGIVPAAKYQNIFDNATWSGWTPKHVTAHGNSITDATFAAIFELDSMEYDDLQFIYNTIQTNIRDQFPINGRTDLMGVTFAVSHFGTPVFAVGYGKASIDNNELSVPTTRFRIASLTKAVTATAIWLVSDSCAINEISQVFGAGGILQTRFNTVGIPNQNIVEDITVGHLLAHTSGLIRDAFSSTTQDGSIQTALNNDAILNGVAAAGQMYGYSNLGYNILAAIVEECSGENFEQFVNDNVFDQAGIHSHIRTAHNNKAHRVKYRDSEYYPQPGTYPFIKDSFFEMYTGAGFLEISPIDYLKTLAVIDGRNDIPDILPQDIIDLQQDIAPNTGSATVYGGLFRLNDGSRQHSGGWTTGTRTFQQMYSNGISATIMLNYNENNIGNVVTTTLQNIIDNLDIEWPCYDEDTITNPGFNKVSVSSYRTVTTSGLRSLRIRTHESNVLLDEVICSEIDVAFDRVTEDKINGTGELLFPESRRDPIPLNFTSECLPTCFGNEIKECPDGTVVARDISNECQFAQCPLEPPHSETVNPTINPTTHPTDTPTNVPTYHSTATHTATPTANPTAVPTANPTVVPTVYPTTNPTNLTTTNIIITNQGRTQRWWVAFYVSQVDLSCGGTVSNVEITDNLYHSGTWRRYNETQYQLHGFYSFFNFQDQFEAPITVRITKTSDRGSNEAIVAPNLLSLTGNEIFDFGTNFCRT